MAGSPLRELLVQLGVDDGDASQKLEAFDSAIGDAKSAAGDLVGVLAALGAAFVAIGAAAISQAVQTGESAEQILEQSTAIGVTTDAYQELSFAAAKYGIDSEKITVILSKLAVDQKAVADGNKETAATYAQLGLSVEEVAAAKPAELLALMADGFTGVTDASDRLAIASGLFGDRIASKLIPLLSGGSAGLAEMAAEAHALGVVMSRESIDSANAFNDRVETLGLLVTGLRNEIGLALIPTLTDLADQLLGWVSANRALISQQIAEYAERIADGFRTAAQALSDANEAVGGADGWVRLAEVIGQLAAAAGIAFVVARVIALGSALWSAGVALVGFLAPLWELVTLVAGLTEALGAGFLIEFLGAVAIAAGPWVLLAAAIAAAVGFLVTAGLALEDIWTYLEGGDSVWGRLIERWRIAPGLLGAVGRTMYAWGEVLRAFGVLAGNAWDGFMDGLDPALRLAMAFASVLEGAVVGAIDAVAQALDGLAPYLDRYAGGLLQLAGAMNSPGAGATAYGAGFSSSSQGFAPTVAAAGAGGGGRSTTVGGDTNNFYGTGMSKEEVQSLLDQRDAQKARDTMAAVSGSDL